MKRSLILFFGVIVFTCMTQKTAGQSDLSVPVENALLWSVSGNGLSSPSYLYGTIHMICKDDFQISSTLKDKFESSKNIYLEIDMDDPNMMMKTAMLSIMKDHSLKDIMNEKDYNELSGLCEGFIGNADDAF